jgi:uncharacterized membrane protein
MLRSARERIFQSVLFEIIGLALVVPVYEALFGNGLQETLFLMVAISLMALVILPVHNATFDRLAMRFHGSSPSERPQVLRILHAITHEVTPAVLTIPLIMLVSGHDFMEAVAIDISLTLFYMVYAYVFYLAYDRLLPLQMVMAK